MLEINLVPEQLRKRRKSQSVSSDTGSRFPKEVLVGLIFVICLLLVCAHLGLQYIINEKFKKHKQFSQEWEELSPQKSNIDKIVENLKGLREKVQSVDQALPRRDILLAQKLNVISDNIPRGIWLMRISLDEDVLIIQGSAVSKNKTEMINVHNFTAKLKDSEDFMRNFGNIELGLIKTRKVNETQIADFTLTAELKTAEEKTE